MDREVADERDLANEWPAPLDLRELGQREPEPPRFIVQDWLPCGYATLFSGHGGVGKSVIGLTLAVCIAAGLAFFGLPVERRRVLYLSCEDRASVLHWRLMHIARHLGIELAALHGWLFLHDLVGEEVVLWERDPQTGLTQPWAFARLRRRMETTAAQVLVVDGVSDTFGGNENSRGEVKRYVNALLNLVPPDAGALLLLGHIAKSAAGNPGTSEGYSGSTGWHNAVRARWYLRPELAAADDDGPRRTGRLLLEVQKGNLSGALPTLIFRWDEAARLFVGEGLCAGGGLVEALRHRNQRRAVLECLDVACKAGRSVLVARQANDNAATLLKPMPGFPATLLPRSTNQQLFALLYQLEADGLIGRENFTTPTRHPSERWQLTDLGKRTLQEP